APGRRVRGAATTDGSRAHGCRTAGRQHGRRAPGAPSGRIHRPRGRRGPGLRVRVPPPARAPAPAPAIQAHAPAATRGGRGGIPLARPRRAPTGALRAELRTIRSRVRRLHEKLFYRPLLDSIASYDAEALSLGPEAMERQLAALGFGAPRNALGHLRALAGQSNRRGRIQALLLP